MKRDLEESDVVELSADEFQINAKKKSSSKRKGKQVMINDVIDVDDEKSVFDMTNKVKLGGNYKGKELIYVSDGDDFDDGKSVSSMAAGVTGVANDGYPNNLPKASSYPFPDNFSYLYQDDDYAHLPQNWSGMDALSYSMQSQFDEADIPNGEEAFLPWWLEPDQNDGQPINFSGPSNFNFNSTQPSSGFGLNQMTHSHDNSSVEALYPSAGLSSANGSKSVSPKHVSLLENHASSSSFAAVQTKVSEGVEAPSANTVYEDATRRLQQFDNFAVVDDYSDHHYANKSLTTQVKAWAKKVQDEWKILQSSLPETIFVRAYESKMSLLRGVIIGPQGTPYHDGLFFFDAMFPSTYPQTPPLVYYHSGGLRLNPNLYNNGKVCLSLLGTWAGQSATENWIAGKSTMLQVLVSIQALILNAKPYFNEPGFASSEGSSRGEKASEKYNEDALIMSLKTMLYSMRRPPKHFEGFVSDYFITRSRSILLACKAYMDGAKVGSISVVDGKAVMGNEKKCSRSLQDNVRMILNSLIDEFSKLGVKNVDEFRIPETKNEQSLDTSGRSSRSYKSMSLKSGKTKKFLAKLKNSIAIKSAQFPPAPNVAYPIPSLWNSSMAAWTSQSAVPPYPTAMLDVPPPAVTSVLLNHPINQHNYSTQIQSIPDLKGNMYKWADV